MNIIKLTTNIIREHIEYRQQILKLAKADIIRTYRGAALGWAWAIIKPAFTIFVYWFAMEIGIRGASPVDGFPYFLWMIAGLIPWFYMSEMLTQGINAIKKYSYLVTKMKFPVATIPTFVSISKLLVNLALVIVMIAIFWIFGYPPDIYYLQLPLYILFMFMFFTVISLLIAPIVAISQDISNLFRSLVTGIFWFSGILYNVDKIKYLWLKKLMMLNPVTFICNGFRNVFVYKTWFFEQDKRLLYFFTGFAILLILAILVYNRIRKDIPDVL